MGGRGVSARACAGAGACASHLAKTAAPDEEILRNFPLACTDLTLTDCPYTIGPFAESGRKNENQNIFDRAPAKGMIRKTCKAPNGRGLQHGIETAGIEPSG